ncbi:MAG: hypothetical protein KGI54_16500 [Pseudomonadota bacterium]|nr:hypothetical protein [Pseudomonadota bacterium]
MAFTSSSLSTGPLAPITNTSLQQSFRQIMVPNTATALYTLSIRSPGSASLPYVVYTFPMSPQSIQRVKGFKSAAYETMGTVNQKGVLRQVDVYGESPVSYIIEGSTGWNRHSNDSYIYTGLQSIQYLQSVLDQYAELNQGQIQGNISQLYTLEFYDYFSQDFWQVEPVGEQGFTQDAGQPLYTRYRFNLVGIKKISAPIISSTSDVIGQLFQGAVGPAVSTLQNTISKTLSAYNL